MLEEPIYCKSNPGKEDAFPGSKGKLMRMTSVMKRLHNTTLSKAWMTQGF